MGIENNIKGNEVTVDKEKLGEDFRERLLNNPKHQDIREILERGNISFILVGEQDGQKIFGVISKKYGNNITSYFSEDEEFLFSIKKRRGVYTEEEKKANPIEAKNRQDLYTDILEKFLRYREIKDENGYYHMYRLEKGNKIGKEVSQDSLEYFDIFVSMNKHFSVFFLRRARMFIEKGVEFIDDLDYTINDAIEEQVISLQDLQFFERHGKITKEQMYDYILDMYEHSRYNIEKNGELEKWFKKAKKARGK